MRLFSTEQVSRYHPDKYADQISDAILTACLKKDPASRVACETLVKNNTVILAGEITSSTPTSEIVGAVRKVAKKLGYNAQEIINKLYKQSPEINKAVGEDGQEDIGAGDQGMVFGYAVDDTPAMMPYGFDLANRIIKVLEWATTEHKILKGDAKTQITVDLDAPSFEDSVHTVLISACHVELETQMTDSSAFLRQYILAILKQHGIEFKEDTRVLINPKGPWTIGGPVADAGLTGRKIVCDQYGGYAPVGGGAFSGKDPTKVDRSAAYAARIYACELLEKYREKGIKEVTVQIGYAIGLPEPLSICVDLKGPGATQELHDEINENIDYLQFTPHNIIKRLNLKAIDYEKLAEGCHYYGLNR